MSKHVQCTNAKNIENWNLQFWILLNNSYQYNEIKCFKSFECQYNYIYDLSILIFLYYAINLIWLLIFDKMYVHINLNNDNMEGIIFHQKVVEEIQTTQLRVCFIFFYNNNERRRNPKS
jgi:hypothetical protein